MFYFSFSFGSTNEPG